MVGMASTRLTAHTADTGIRSRCYTPRLTQPPAQPEVHEDARGDAAEDAAVLEEVGHVARVRGGDARGGADVVRQPEQEDVDHEPGPIRGGFSAKRALTPRSLNVKLGPRRKGNKGRAVWLI